MRRDGERSRKAGRDVGQQAGRHVDCWVGWRTDRQTSREANSQASRLVWRHRETGGEGGRQADGQTNSLLHCLLLWSAKTVITFTR